MKSMTLSGARFEYYVLLGPTWSSKSTLLKCILGLHTTEQDVRITKEIEAVRDPLRQNILAGEIRNWVQLREECVICFRIERKP